MSEASATYAGSPKRVQNIGLRVDHYGLNKFGSRTPEYRIILSRLLDLIAPIKQNWYSVPLQTIPSYTERRGLSSQIEQMVRVCYDNGSVPHALVLYGLGGAGKTQLALDFVETHKTAYNPIFWLDAKSAETVRSSFDRCSRELGLIVDQTVTSGSSLIDSSTVQGVLTWLHRRTDARE